MRSQGAVLLARTGLSEETIATKARVSRVSVNHWVHGNRLPSKAKRKLLKKHFGISEDAWELAAKPIPPPPAIAANVDAGPSEQDPFDLEVGFEEIARSAAAQLRALRVDTTLTYLERARATKELERTLDKLDRRQRGFERAFLRSKKWQQLCQTMRAWLHAHPEALADLEAALEAFERPPKNGGDAS